MSETGTKKRSLSPAGKKSRALNQLVTTVGQVLEGMDLRETEGHADQYEYEQETLLYDALGRFLARTGWFLQDVAKARARGRPGASLPTETRGAEEAGTPEAAAERTRPSPPPTPPDPPLDLERLRGPDLPNGRPQLGDTGFALPATLRPAGPTGPPGGVAVVVVEPPPVILRPPPEPAFPVRSLAEIQEDMQVAIERLSGIDLAASDYDLIVFKQLVCRQRRAYQECEEGHHHLMLREVEDLWKRLNEVRLRQLGGVSRDVLVMDRYYKLPDPNLWTVLIEHYGDLANAIEAVQWFALNQSDLRGLEGREVLEGAAATQLLLLRFIHRYWGNIVYDDQAKALYGQVVALSKEIGLRIRVLAERDQLPDAELIRITNDTSSQYFTIRSRVEGRRVQQESIQQVIGMTELSDFAKGPKKKEDVVKLRDTVAYALEMGIAPTNKALRDAVIPWLSFLEDDPRLGQVVAEARKELERRAAAPPELETQDNLTPALRKQFEEVKPLVQGKKVVVLGGEPWPEQLEKLQRFGFGEIEWPAGTIGKGKGASSPTQFKGLIQNADLVLLMIRCMGHALSDTKALKKLGTPFYICRGFGFARMVLDLHSQLTPAR